MDDIVYKVVGSRGQWFTEHAGGRFGPFRTKEAAMKIAKAARQEGETFGIKVAVMVADRQISAVR